MKKILSRNLLVQYQLFCASSLYVSVFHLLNRHNKTMNNLGVKQVTALLCEGFRYDSYENNKAANNFVFSTCFE